MREPSLSLFTVGNTKTLKSIEQGYFTLILHLKPSLKLCPFSTEGCREACLNTAGRGRFDNVQKARDRRTTMYEDNFTEFKRLAIYEIAITRAYCDYMGLKLCVRMNGTSDVIWEKKFPELFTAYPDLQFYDYTKIPRRETPANYSLVFSRSETNEALALQEYYLGKSIAVVFDKTPDTWMGYPVFDGDNNDLRFLDPPHSIIGLKAKGRAKYDKSGFVVRS